MHHHEYFNLWLHDNQELRTILDSDIMSRVTLHEWPLSCVQRVTTVDRQTLIYKTQFGPTVEAEFYANAVSELLPAVQTIYQSDGHVCLLTEFIAGPLLETLSLTEEEVVHIGRTVLAQIATIDGELPAYLDLSDEEKWRALIKDTLKEITALIDQGKFTLVNQTIVRDLERRAFSKSILTAIQAGPGYVHHDLGGDNLFVLPDRYCVIDWQRPIWGPTDLDLATLLASLGFDPLKHVDESVIQILRFLQIHWLTQCKAKWFPEGATYDQQVAELAQQIIKGTE